LKTTVEEIAEDSETSTNPSTVERLKSALEEASDAADDLEDERNQ
jgi:hypothetical protein